MPQSSGNAPAYWRAGVFLPRNDLGAVQIRNGFANIGSDLFGTFAGCLLSGNVQPYIQA